jgi:hypothetical protein
MNDSLKPVVDGFSISGTVAVIFGYLPEVTALLTLIWTLIRIYELQTVQNLIAKLKAR